MDKLTYKYYRKNGGKKVFIILHGSGPVGVETSFIASILTLSQQRRIVSLVLIFHFAIVKKLTRVDQN